MPLCNFGFNSVVLKGSWRKSVGSLEMSFDCRINASLLGSSESTFGGHCYSSIV